MSRLYDRVMAHGCEPLTMRHAIELMSLVDDHREEARKGLAEQIGREPSDDEVARALQMKLHDLEQKRADEAQTADLLHGMEAALVFSAEEVADYCGTLPEETDTFDLVASVAPPFESFFVEFQHRPIPTLGRLDSWGVHFSGSSESREGGWHVEARLVGEFLKGRPFGPIVFWRIPLNRDGTLVPLGTGDIPVDREGNLLPQGSHLSSWLYSGDLLGQPEEQAFFFVGSMNLCLVSALFTVSLLHCKNVDVRPVDPPERLSRKHERKHGRPLTRYYTLDIQPMRRILDYEGEAQAKGLRHALHICRGHFKTFTEEAPLFGRHVGTYWWESQVRGSAEEGVVEKDYRVRLDQGLGREYVQADEHPEIRPSAPEHTGRDPDLGGRGLRAHNIAQNLLASAIEQAGYVPRRPKPDEPQYDLAWEGEEVVWVAEVKSITPQNEERQLRLAVGQVVRYRQLLAAERRAVRAMIAPSLPSSCETVWMT